MPPSADPGYGDEVTSNRATVDSERPALHALAGAALALVSGLVLGSLLVLWGAAVWSLVTGPTGAWYLDVLYVLMAPAGPIALLWCVWELASVHRARFSRLLGSRVEEPSPPNWGPVLLRPWRNGDTWRQLAYHAVALMLTPAALLVLLAGPRGAGMAARVDKVLARWLLGPGRAEELARQAQVLTDRIDFVDAQPRRDRRCHRRGAAPDRTRSARRRPATPGAPRPEPRHGVGAVR
mgnify:CR=1 FL=1